MTVPGVYSPEQGGKRYITELGQTYDGFIQDACWDGAIPVSVEYKPSDTALQAHVDKVIASDGVDDSRAVEVMARAVYESWTDRRWDSIGDFTRNQVRQDMRTALGALRALEGDA